MAKAAKRSLEEAPNPSPKKAYANSTTPKDHPDSAVWEKLSKGPPASISERCPPVYNTILENIGNTPLVRCDKIAKLYGLECNLLAKCEFFNAGGSVKDRIGKMMVEMAEKSGQIKPGDTLIEPTSGNTGIGLALAAAIKGYRCIIVLPEKMSNEKVYVLKALGAEIVRTPTEAASAAPDSHISVARRMQKEIKNSHILDQYANPGNPLAHFDGTAEEIIAQTGGKVNMLVAGAGTGGTISGISKKLKQKCPGIEVIGVDPVGSILAEPEEMNEDGRDAPYLLEGIGYDFIPEVLDRKLVDSWKKCNDKDCFVMMRRLIQMEGLLCGGSCGAAMQAAVESAKKLKKGETCVVILPDSTRNYMTKALSDDWMISNKFVDGDVIKPKQFNHWWSSWTVSNIATKTPLTIQEDVTCREAIQLMQDEGFDTVPVLSNDGSILGVVSTGGITAKLLSGKCTSSSPIKEVIYKSFQAVTMSDTLESLAGVFDHEPFALVTATQRLYSKDNGGPPVTKSIVCAVVTRIDLLDFITKGERANNPSSPRGFMDGGK